MADWVRVTETNDRPIWINLDHVVTMQISGNATDLRLASPSRFEGSYTICVKEHPDQLVRSARQP